jgi:hypothetical protein
MEHKFHYWKKEIIKNIIVGKEIKWRKENRDKILSTIAYQVNTSKKFRNYQIEKGLYGCRQRKL